MGSYIGKRVVPKHCGYWDSGRSYEMLSVVYENTSGNSYISRKEVPAGTDISQEEYWALCSDFNMQMDLMGKHFTETEQRIKADNDSTEQAILADNDATEKAIRSDNDSTEQTILADNAKTREHVDTSLAETTKALTETVTSARDDMTAQKESFDATAKQLNTRMDSVLAAGTGAGDTEILDARVDVDGVTHDTVGAHIRRVGKEVADARAGFGGEVYPDLKTAMESFSDPFVKALRMPTKGYAVVLAGKSEYTSVSVENILDRSGTPRACKYSATILQDYDTSSIMTHSVIYIGDFNTYLLGKKAVIEMFSPIEGIVNFSIGSQSTSGSGDIDDPNGCKLQADGSLYMNSISYNFHVKEGYNEITINLSEDLPQVQKLKEIIAEKEWGQMYLNVIPFQWNQCTFRPVTGETYEFYIALREEPSGDSQSNEGFFQMPIMASAMNARHGEQADHAKEAEHADEADFSIASNQAEVSRNAGVIAVADEPYISDKKRMAIVVDDLTRQVSVSFDKSCTVSTGTGFSFRIGTVGELAGKRLIFRQDITDGFRFDRIAINFGASYGGKSYVEPEGAVTQLGGAFYAIDFDLYREMADTRGITYDDNTDCWLMNYRNADWDLSGLADGEVVTNTYNLYIVDPDSFVYSRQLEERNAELENEMAAMSERITAQNTRIGEQDTKIEEQAGQITALTEALTKVQESNVLWGKKWFATGDSFTSGGSVEDDKYFTDEPYQGKIKTYPLFIARRNNMDCINDAISGSIMALSKKHLEDPENVDINTKRPFSYQRYLTIPEDVDYITLWFGINDASNTNLGTIDDTTNETFYGAWNVVMEWILTNRPWAHVGIIITNGSNKAYREAEREIAKKWGIPYLDMMGDDQVPVMTLGREEGLCTTAYNLRRSTFSVGHTPNGDSHPCWQAHEYESTFIEAFLRRL